MDEQYRQGATGALLDVYEKAIHELADVISEINDNDLGRILDYDTTDENCRSFQTILTHVVYAGFGYAASMYNLKESIERPAKISFTTIADYTAQLFAMLTFTEKVLYNFSDDKLEEFDDSKKIKSGWGQVYDIEQMMEHAIVHILRHRRQIERLKKTF